VRRLGEPPSLKVLDFGVAKARRAAGDGEETAVGLVLGTPAYMPPEQWAGQAVDGRADIYALAVTAYLSLTGRLPYARGQVAELVLSSNPPGPVPPHKLNPRVPVALSEVLLRALARFPDERFPTAADFKRALLAAVAVPKPPRPVSAEPLAPPPVEAPRRTPRPPVTPPPVRAEAAETATPPPSWTAKVQRGAGASAVEVRCTQLSRGGLFMCCAEPFPQLFSRVAFTLQLGGEEHSCVGEVVQHVGTDLARAWGTSSGVGVQFINPPPRLRELVQRLQPVRPSPPQSLPPPVRASGMGRS
jgi:serine/threonine-protein kinase